MTGDPSNMDIGPKKRKAETAKDNPPGYEGKEHVKYKDPGHTREKIRIPEDEPHMKSHVGKEEMHEMEDNFHMGIPDQTEDELPKVIKRARMNMDKEPHEVSRPLHGDLVTQTPESGVHDESGEEKYGPHDMQEEEGGDSKKKRKKIAIAVIKRKMSKRE